MRTPLQILAAMTFLRLQGSAARQDGYQATIRDRLIMTGIRDWRGAPIVIDNTTRRERCRRLLTDPQV